MCRYFWKCKRKNNKKKKTASKSGIRVAVTAEHKHNYSTKSGARRWIESVWKRKIELMRFFFLFEDDRREGDGCATIMAVWWWILLKCEKFKEFYFLFWITTIKTINLNLTTTKKAWRRRETLSKGSFIPLFMFIVSCFVYLRLHRLIRVLKTINGTHPFALLYFMFEIIVFYSFYFNSFANDLGS